MFLLVNDLGVWLRRRRARVSGRVLGRSKLKRIRALSVGVVRFGVNCDCAASNRVRNSRYSLLGGDIVMF